MRCNWKIGCLFLGLLLVAGGCAQKPIPRVPPEIPTMLPSEEEARRVREETREAIPMLPSGERDLGAQDLPPAVEATAEREPEPLPVEVETRLGYRVQLYAASSESYARKRAAEYETVFDEKVYVAYEGLLYKVRIGDCTSMDEASALRRKAVEAGQGGAFIVDTQVNVR